MSVRDDKDKIIKAIMDLRTMIGNLSNRDNEDEVHDTQRQLNKIHDMVFNM